MVESARDVLLLVRPPRSRKRAQVDNGFHRGGKKEVRYRHLRDPFDPRIIAPNRFSVRFWPADVSAIRDYITNSENSSGENVAVARDF